MALGLGNWLALGAQGGGAVPCTECTIMSPAAQSILATGVAVTLSATAPHANAVTFYQDGVSIGVGVKSDDTFTLSWTPGDVDYSTQLTAVADGSVNSAAVTIVVAEASRFPAISAMPKVGPTVTGGQSDPLGGTSAFYINPSTATNSQQVLFAQYTSAPTEFNSGVQIWARPNGHNILSIKADGTSHQAYIDLVTGESQTSNSHVKIVERGSNGWVRVWFRLVGSVAARSNYSLFMCKTFGDTTPDSTSDEGMYLYGARTCDGVLPFTAYQKMGVRRTAATGNLETWTYTHPYINTSADVGSARTIDVIKPTGWSAAATYTVLFALTAQARATENVQTVFDAAGVADTYGVVVVVPYFADGVPWYGCKDDGSINEQAFMSDCVTAFATEFLSCASTRARRLLIGYSKSGWGAMSLMLLRSDVWGFASTWDVPWVLDWATESVSLGLAARFGTEANFNLYDPYQILAAHLSAVNDKTRISVRGYETWNADFEPMTTLLTANNVPFTQESVDRGAHSYSAGWLATALTDLMAMAA